MDLLWVCDTDMLNFTMFCGLEQTPNRKNSTLGHNTICAVYGHGTSNHAAFLEEVL